MTLPTTKVKCNLFDQIGDPAINALVHLRLTGTDIDSAHGIVLPETIKVQADANGYFEVDVWPNERGQRNTQYKVWALEGEGCASPIWDVLATVPETSPANLRDLIDTPPPSNELFLKSVTTDDTLKGDGTPSSPLGAHYALTLEAGEALGGHRIVIAENGAAFYADNTTKPGQVVGMTRHAASAGEDILIQFAGDVVEPSWSWSPGPIYLGIDGLMTQTRPLAGSVIRVATALTSNRAVIERHSSIERL